MDNPTINNHGTKFWRNADGLYHREDGPAVEYADGSTCWVIDGNYHREDGPAIEYINDYKSWFINDKLHRDDGPAYESADGYKAWYINGKELIDQEFNKYKLSLDNILNIDYE